MEDDYDHVYEVNVDLEIERDMGLGKGCTVGKDNEKDSMVLFRDGVKGEDMNDNGFEYAPSGFLHSVHESDYEDVS